MAASKRIVPIGEILTENALKGELWSMRTLSLALTTPDECIKWLAKRRLIHNSVRCPTCFGQASLVHYEQGLDKHRWSCRPCNFRQSVRHGSFFGKSKLSLSQLVFVIYCWTQDFPQINISREAGVQSVKTIVDWCSFCRDECEKFVETQSAEIGGIDEDGDPIVVEIDESYYFHRKYQRGEWRPGHWVFGGIERVSGKCFLVQVADRTAETLKNEILQHILPGSHIVSDGWAAYAKIDQINDGIYTHDTVIHERNFVDPDDRDVHTQNIENLWMRAKRKLKRQFGTSHALFTSYLHEFVFRNAFRGQDVFTNFLHCVSLSYPTTD